MNYKWITAAEIDAWTEREPRRAQELLPKLIIKLILSSTNLIDFFNFPSGKSIQYAGYDGILKSLEQTNYIPLGQSVWEFGTDKNIINKFNDDFNKRTNDPLQIFKPDTVFVFVTSRIWYHSVGIAQKIAQSKSNSDWKDVQILDANYLEQWLEGCPSVSAWFSNIINKNIGRYVSIEDYWKDKTQTTTPILNEKFFLIGRDEAIENLLKWFQTNNNHLLISADSKMEALLVLSACLLNIDDTEHEQILSNCLIVEDETSWNNLINFTNKNTVLIPYFNPTTEMRYPNNCRSILPVNKYSHVYNKTNILSIDISKQRKDDFELAMKDIGFSVEDISNLTYNTKRSFFALYRIITRIPSRKIPNWAQSADIENLIPALFMGSWNERRDGDKALVEALSGCKYDKYCENISKWLVVEDAPLYKVDDVYMIVSVSDLWNVLWDRISSDSFQKFCSCIPSVFGVKDPTFELPEDQWFAASIYGKNYSYSQSLLDGLVITMIMLSERNDLPNFFNSTSTKRDVDYIVKSILESVKDWQGWYTVIRHFPLLIEASPDAVLDKLEEKAKTNDDDFWMLFKQPEDVIMGRTFYPSLLWALEKLVWEPEYVIRAVNILILFAEKRFEYKMANSPINSLYQIFCLWYPQTCLSVDQRVKVIENALKKYSYTGWQLIKSLLPNVRHQTVSPITKSRWKDVDSKVNSAITNIEYWDSVEKITKVSLSYITPDAEKWKIIFSSISSFIPMIGELIDKCTQHTKAMIQEDVMEICNEIGDLINRHRQFPNASWSMPNDILIKLEKLYYEILPNDLIRYNYLFKYRAYDINPIPVDMENHNYDERNEKLYQKRKKAINDIYEECGIDGLYKIIRTAEDTRDLGSILAKNIFNELFVWDTIFKIKELNINVASVIIWELYQRNGLINLINSLNVLTDNQIGFIMCTLPFERNIWDQVSKFSEIVQANYWENISIFGIVKKDNEESKYAIDKLLEYNRPYSLMDVLSYSEYKDINYIIRILFRGLDLYPNSEKNGMTLNSVPSYDIVNLFEKIYQDGNYDEELVARLELSYLSVFDPDYELKCLTKQLKQTPSLFVELMTYIYKKDTPDESVISEGLEVRASRAQDILYRFRSIPGYDNQKDTMDDSLFWAWIDEAYRLSREFGYITAFELCVSTLLSYSPIGKDGIWPCECVRNFFEENATETLSRHFIIGRQNQRGVHTVTGGREEKQLAELYAVYADKLMFESPKMAAIVRQISDSYLEESKREQMREMRDFY